MKHSILKTVFLASILSTMFLDIANISAMKSDKSATLKQVSISSEAPLDNEVMPLSDEEDTRTYLF